MQAKETGLENYEYNELYFICLFQIEGNSQIVLNTICRIGK